MAGNEQWTVCWSQTVNEQEWCLQYSLQAVWTFFSLTDICHKNGHFTLIGGISDPPAAGFFRIPVTFFFQFSGPCPLFPGISDFFSPRLKSFCLGNGQCIYWTWSLYTLKQISRIDAGWHLTLRCSTLVVQVKGGWPFYFLNTEKKTNLMAIRWKLAAMWPERTSERG